MIDVEGKKQELKDRYRRIQEIKAQYKEKGQEIPVSECQRILKEEQDSLAEIYDFEFGKFSYIQRLKGHLGTPKISERLENGLDHNDDTIIFRNMDRAIFRMREMIAKKPNGITKKSDVHDEATYLEYMANTDGVSLDHYLTILPHELRHLYGSAGDKDFPGYGAIVEGKTELDARRIAKKYDIPYFLERNYSEEAKYVEKLESIVGIDTINTLASYKSVRLSQMLDKYDGDPDKKAAVLEFIRIKEGNSTKKAILLLYPEMSKEEADALRKASDYIHGNDLKSDYFFLGNPDLEELIAISPNIRGPLYEHIFKTEDRLEFVEDVLGEDFQKLNQEYEMIDKERLNFLNTFIIGKLNHEQLEEFKSVVNRFEQKYHSGAEGEGKGINTNSRAAPSRDD